MAPIRKMSTKIPLYVIVDTQYLIYEQFDKSKEGFYHPNYPNKIYKVYGISFGEF